MGHRLENVVPSGAPLDAVVLLELDPVGVGDLGGVSVGSDAQFLVGVVSFRAIHRTLIQSGVVDRFGLSFDSFERK